MSDFLEISIVTNRQDFDSVMQLRNNVFVDEDGIDKDKEFDGNDFCSTHIIARLNGKPAGAMRIRYFGDFVKFERMCVAKPFREVGIARKIMDFGKQFAAKKGFTKVFGMCEEHLLPYWQKQGFTAVADVPPVKQNGLILLPIELKLDALPSKITVKSNPNTINATEGSWDKILPSIINSKHR